MEPRDLEAQITLRHREPGLLRFALPEVLCAAPASGAVHDALVSVDGVWRVDLYPSLGKLSVRYHEGVCSVRDVALALRSAVAAAAAAGLLSAGALASSAAARNRPGRGAASPGERARVLRSQASLVLRILKRSVASDPVLRGVLNERALTSFFNDVLTFYLVKVHWDLVTKRWMAAPLHHRYEWLAVFWLTFQLVRSRRGTAAKAS